MNKKLLAGMGVALAVGLMLGVTVLGSATAGSNGSAPESNGPAVEAPISGSALIMEATAVEEGAFPDVSSEDVQLSPVPAGSGTVIVSSDGLISAGSDGTIGLPEGLTLNADGTITDAEGTVVGGSTTITDADGTAIGGSAGIIQASWGEGLPVLDVNDPNLHVGSVPADSGTMSITVDADGNVTTEK